MPAGHAVRCLRGVRERILTFVQHICVGLAEHVRRMSMARDSNRMPLPAETPDAIACQLEAFRKKFGRDPGPDDPIFFDPDATEPVPLNPQQYEQDMIETMAQAGVNPAFIYAFKRTGRIVTESNKHRFSEKELRRWNDAISEYEHEVDSGKVI